MPELLEVGTALVPHPRIGEQTAGVAGTEDADGEVDVLAIERHLRETRLREATELEVGLATDAEVEGAGVELVQLLLASTDATSGKERRHGVGDGLLDVGERLVGCIGTAKCGDFIT